MTQGADSIGREHILTTEALAFIGELASNFGDRARQLVRDRGAQQRPFKFLDVPVVFQVRPPPHDLVDRRVEITGPVDRKMIINALNSGANTFMADFEDSNSPTWDNVVQGQVNLYDAVRRTIEFTNEAGKRYRLNDQVATLLVRPRGWHLFERNHVVNGRPVHGALFDFGLYVFHNAAELLARSSGPYFYFPKLESHLEARLWNDICRWSENRLGLPNACIRATVLIETLPAAFEMDAILFELQERSTGLNCGRWDYIFSFIKKQADDPSAVLPDRSLLTMDGGFLAAYCRKLIQTCHLRGAHAMGGMAAQIPIKDDPVANAAAMARIKADKEREFAWGHDGTWVAHPGLIPIAKEAFKAWTPDRVVLTTSPVTEADMLAIPEGARTDAGLRHNIRVGVQYLEAWLRGAGCVPLYNLMEDAATAEISRAQVWQWCHHGVIVGDSVLTKERLLTTIAEETSTFEGGRYQDAIRLFTDLSIAPSFEDFLTVPAYEILSA